MAEIFEFKTNFSARLNEENRNYLSENKIDLIPEDIPEADLTNKDVLLHMAKKALSKSINKKEHEKLKSEFQSLNEIQLENVKTINRLQTELDRVQSEYTNLQTEYKKVLPECSRLQEALDNAGEQYYTKLEEFKELESKLLSTNEQLPGDTDLIISIKPEELAVANAFAHKLSKLTKQQINVSTLIWDLFWRYIKKQETQIAFPFVLTVSEINKIIANHKKESINV